MLSSISAVRRSVWLLISLNSSLSGVKQNYTGNRESKSILEDVTPSSMSPVCYDHSTDFKATSTYPHGDTKSAYLQWKYWGNGPFWWKTQTFSGRLKNTFSIFHFCVGEELFVLWAQNLIDTYWFQHRKHAHKFFSAIFLWVGGLLVRWHLDVLVCLEFRFRTALEGRQ